MLEQLQGEAGRFSKEIEEIYDIMTLWHMTQGPKYKAISRIPE